MASVDSWVLSLQRLWLWLKILMEMSFVHSASLSSAVDVAVRLMTSGLNYNRLQFINMQSSG